MMEKTHMILSENLCDSLETMQCSELNYAKKIKINWILTIYFQIFYLSMNKINFSEHKHCK